jgi:hypothetical protein
LRERWQHGREAADDDLVVVEFASDPPPLSPGAARAALGMLLGARVRQAGKNQQDEPGGLAECPDGMSLPFLSACDTPDLRS